MNIVGKFMKVSYTQFYKDYVETFNDSDEAFITECYNNIKLPKRATADSAGYDFYSPITFKLEPGTTIKIPTGIRVQIDDGWFLGCFPRSGLGFKYRLQLNNTVGIIDAKYYESDNEGHIFAKITNDTNEGKTLLVNAGTAFMQGVFLPFGITVDDNATGVRNGGFGSTDNMPEVKNA